MTAAELSRHEILLLNAALNPDAAIAAARWQEWTSEVVLEAAPLEDLRLLPAIYAHLNRIAPTLELPHKLRGKARATFTRNTLLAHGSLAIIDELSRQVSVMLTKGLGICIRFGAWSSRSMADVDIHVPADSLETACEVLGRAGWTADYGMTVPSLLHRTSLRRDSWNFSRGPISVDLHWRLRDVPAVDWLGRQMWASGEQVEVSGRKVLLQSPEFAFVSSLNHGFLLGSKSDALQTIVDTAWLLPRCHDDRLGHLLVNAQLLGPFDDLLTIFDTVGLSSLVPPALTERRRSAAAATRRRPSPSKPRTERAVLRRPVVYRLWRSLGRKARVERLLLWLTGPFSKPLNGNQPCKDDYDLRDCRDIDVLGGPGWAWPEADHSGVWSDRFDARLLIPLRQVGDHLIVLGFSDERHHSPNWRIDVFANGSFLTTIDFKDGLAASDRCLVVSRHVLFGRWVELSLRPRPYLGHEARWPEDYGLTRSAPVRRLRVLDLERMTEMFRPNEVPLLYLRILRGEEPHASKWRRIQSKIDTSPDRDSPELPAGFDPIQYTLFYPDLFQEEVDPYAHFLTCGRREGRGWR